jgi:hypothetical protein
VSAAEPDSEDAHIRDVYAAFGVAVYFAQCVETQLVNYLSLLRLGKLGRPMTTDEVEVLQERLFGATFGRNLSEVRDLLGVDWAFAPQLAEALNVRNHLVHHWMRERILDMGTTKKRDGLLGELEQIRLKFEAADAALVERCLVLHERMGVPRERNQEEYERLTELSRQDGPDAR